MSISNRIVARVLIGSAIGALLGLILLIVGIAVVLKAVDGRSSRQSPGLEVEVHDADPNRQAERPWGTLPSDEGRAGYDDRYDPDQDPYEARRYGEEGDRHGDWDDEDADEGRDYRQWDSNPYGDHDRRDHERERDHDRRDRDEASGGSNRATYPNLEAPPPPPVTVPRRAEPLPESSRSQWRSIFEDEAPRPRAAAPAPQATRPAPAPRPEAAPQPRPAPRPAPPRTAPEAKKDEESLFY